MGTTTISLSDDVYERLKAAKRDEESFSDVVRRHTRSQLSEYFGVLDDEAADELEKFIERRGADRAAAWEQRRKGRREDLGQ